MVAVKAALDAANAAIDRALMTVLDGADNALGSANNAVFDADKALKAAADDTVKATAQTTMDAANAALPTAQAADDATRAADRADLPSTFDATTADAGKANRSGHDDLRPDCRPTGRAYPTRIRYSGLSLPCRIGNGWFGGLLTATVLAISAQMGNICSGLWYRIVIALVTVVIGTLLVPNGTRKKWIFAE